MLGQVLSLIIILLLILIVCGCLTRPHWKVGPKREYHKTVKRFGNPSYLKPGPGGVAVWTRFKESCPFTRIMIIDESVPHDKPVEHCDFIYTTINYTISREMRPNVLNISESLMYDSLKEELTARCGTLEANIATLVLADKVNNNLVTASEVYAGDKYKAYIMKAEADAPTNYRILQSIKDNYEMKKIDYDRCN